MRRRWWNWGGRGGSQNLAIHYQKSFALFSVAGCTESRIFQFCSSFWKARITCASRSMPSASMSSSSQAKHILSWVSQFHKAGLYPKARHLQTPYCCSGLKTGRTQNRPTLYRFRNVYLRAQCHRGLRRSRPTRTAVSAPKRGSGSGSAPTCATTTFSSSLARCVTSAPLSGCGKVSHMKYPPTKSRSV